MFRYEGMDYWRKDSDENNKNKFSLEIITRANWACAIIKILEGYYSQTGALST